MPEHILRRFSFIALCSLWQGLGAASAFAEAPYAVAGLRPHIRPEGAPRITAFEKTPVWKTQVLKGVVELHPQGLGFLEGQGAWYTPFTHPGMPGPYDLRGWHATNKLEQREIGQ